MIVDTPLQADLVKKGDVVLPTPPREVYFDFTRNCYWTRNQRGGWISVNESQLKRMLRKEGVSPDRSHGSHVSPLDERLLQIQEAMDVYYAGPLAGHFSGTHLAGEKRILVTESPQLIEAKEGEWPILKALIKGLLVEGDVDQRDYLYAWLKIALESLAAGRPRPGQCLVLCGPHACGKSLLQAIITKLLGGRSAKPYQYMSGATPFNADLFEAEHLMIEDDQSSTDIRARRSFGAKLKEFTVNTTQRLHAKNRQAINGLEPNWHLSITLNDEPENLMVLPPLDDSLEDKFILLRAFKKQMPMPTDTLIGRNAFWARLQTELPAFAHFLKSWKIPVKLQSDRFGVTHFHHPELVKEINNLAPEEKLLTLIDAALFSTPAAGAWSGSAEQLRTKLKNSEHCDSNEVRRLLDWPSACGVYLGRLAKRYPGRVQADRSSKFRGWIIRPPG